MLPLVWHRAAAGRPRLDRCGLGRPCGLLCLFWLMVWKGGLTGRAVLVDGPVGGGCFAP